MIGHSISCKGSPRWTPSAFALAEGARAKLGAELSQFGNLSACRRRSSAIMGGSQAIVETRVTLAPAELVPRVA